MNAELQNVLALLASLPDTTNLPLAERRRLDDENGGLFPLSAGVEIEQEAAPFKGEWVRARDVRRDAVLLYLHGGAYVFCSPISHRHLVAALSAAAGVSAFALDYRLAPESPFPAAVEDAVAAYRSLLAEGFAPERIAIAGDSAGGGLTVATMVALREQGVPQPAAGVCISPWADLTMTAESYHTRPDAMITHERLSQWAQMYLGDAAATNPLASPVFADLRELPPLLIQVGTAEALFDDSVKLEAQAKAAGVAVTLEVWEEMIHVWHYFHPMLSAGREAVACIGEFVGNRIG